MSLSLKFSFAKKNMGYVKKIHAREHEREKIHAKKHEIRKEKERCPIFLTKSKEKESCKKEFKK